MKTPMRRSAGTPSAPLAPARAGRSAGRLGHAIAVLALTALAFASTAVGFAQPATGGIEGRVQSLVTGDYLNNARVAVKGTNLVTLTDAQKLRRRDVQNSPEWSTFQIANDLGSAYTAGITGSF